MGAWGIKPLENDDASDFIADFEDGGKSILILEKAFDEILKVNPDDYLEVGVCGVAVAASEILHQMLGDLSESDRKRLMEKSNNSLKRILNNSELKDLWEENPENYSSWVKTLEDLIK